MGSMKKWMLGAALAAGIVGMSAAPAQAARVLGVYVGAPGYVAPYPGPGYVWVDGYWANGYWVPGYWNYVGVGPGVPRRHRDRPRRVITDGTTAIAGSFAFCCLHMRPLQTGEAAFLCLLAIFGV